MAGLQGPMDQKTLEALLAITQAQLAAQTQRESDDAVAKMQEAEIKLISSLYDKAAAYTNVFVIGGYAAFWGLWATTKAYISPGQALLCALLMLISIAAFVFFEVYKQQRIGSQLGTRIAILQDPEALRNPASYADALKRYSKAQEADNVTFFKTWNITSNVSIATALASVALLGGSFIYHMF